MIARLAVFFAVFLFAFQARAGRCESAAKEWIARCAQTSGVNFELASCPGSVAIVASKDLRIELSTSDKAFVRVGTYGLSPVGSFSDWKLEPEPHRHALDALAACVKAEAPTTLLEGDAPVQGGHETQTSVRKPWLLLAAAVLALAASVRGIRGAVLALAGIGSVILLRHLIQPFAFFHQNGQGPLWIEFAFHGDAGPYGPGYGEVFQWIAQRRRPEQGVMALQELLAATIPLSAYVIARQAGARLSTAMVLAATMAFDPVLARVSRSESYFSLMASLLFAAAAVVAKTDRRHRILGLFAAGLLIAQAARVHPVAWVPAALVPLVLLARPGRPRDRVKRALIAAIAIGLVAAPFVLPTLRATLHGELGASFMPGARRAFGSSLVASLSAVGAASIFAWFFPKVGLRALILVAVVATVSATNVLAVDSQVVHAAHLHLYLPALVAAIAAIQPSTALTVAAMVHVVAERPLRALPTDARELEWAMEWRESLPKGSSVASLQRVDKRLLVLPLVGEGLPRSLALDEDKPTHYYRSSLCSTPEGAPLCAYFEATHTLRLLSARRLPSVASLPWAPMPAGEIEIALYAVE